MAPSYPQKQAMEQEYCIPSGYGEAELVEKRSRFIGRVWPVENEAEALARIAEMRTTYWDARHNVYAYIIRSGQTRYSDDGEPQGTSGMPTLGVFQNEGIFNVCCVITRYFGGILLGAGGLVRAYSKTAKLTLDAAGTSIMREWDTVLIPCPYPLYERVKVILSQYEGIVEETEFGAEVVIQALLPVTQTPPFAKAVMDASAGMVQPEGVGTVFRAVRVR